MKKEEEAQAEEPKTRTITLPDGTTREISEDDMKRFQQQRSRSGGQTPAGQSNPSTQ
jgi:hypothetical protein